MSKLELATNLETREQLSREMTLRHSYFEVWVRIWATRPGNL